jgi:hypothetical protein
VSRLELNLARRPFVNSRPVLRLTVLLLTLGAALAAANLWLYGQYLVGSGEKARHLAELEQSIGAERAGADEARRRLAGLDLERQNATVRFLNGKIAERAFSWGLLLDRLAEVLPDDVRLIALGHDEGQEGARTSPGEAASGSARNPPVRLSIDGEAKTDEALLAVVDALFAHPAFRNPNLQRETRQGGEWLRFDLAVTYLPDTPEVGTAAAEPDASQGEVEPSPEQAPAPEEVQ